MPKISIIVPFYNNLEKIEKVIKNLLKQKYKDIEIILINDNSTDDCESIIIKYIKNPKIRYYINNKKTIGVGSARNLGIEKANGKYIMFVDVDDLIDENLLKKMKKYIEDEIDIIKYDLEMIKNNQKIQFKSAEFDVLKGEEGFNRLCYKDKFLDSPCVYLIKKEMFIKTGLKFTENTYHEDFGLIPLLIITAQTMVSTDYIGYYYIQTENSIMRNNDYEKKMQKVNDKFTHYKDMEQYIRKIDISKSTAENLKLYYTNSIILSLKDLKKNDRKKFKQKIKYMGILKNIKPDSFKHFFKKIILNIDIDLYLFVRR